MTISVSVLSHAFFTEKGACRSPNRARDQFALCSSSPRSSSDVDTNARVVQAPAELATGRNKSKRRGNRKRNARGPNRNNVAMAENNLISGSGQCLPADLATCSSVASSGCPSSSPIYLCPSASSSSESGVAELLMRDIREECSSALGIDKDDLDLFGLCHIQRTLDRARLLKDRSGVVHIGVMVRNSDLNLQTIEKLIVHKDKAEQEAESFRVQVNEKMEDLHSLKLKYEKLTDEVLRLRTMVNRANNLRKESEKATEILRLEFEKLVKSLFSECTDGKEDL